MSATYICNITKSITYLKLHDLFEHNILKVKSILARKFLQPQ
jgi:hypothetical protein